MSNSPGGSTVCCCFVPVVCMVFVLSFVWCDGLRSVLRDAASKLKSLLKNKPPTIRMQVAWTLGVGGPFLRMHGNAINHLDFGEDILGEVREDSPLFKGGGLHAENRLLKKPSTPPVIAWTTEKTFSNRTQMSGLAN